jgi:DNA-binding response OmpR family regulator
VLVLDLHLDGLDGISVIRSIAAQATGHRPAERRGGSQHL